MISNLFRRWTNRGRAASKRDRRRAPSASFHPRIEALEERCVLSTVLLTIDPAVHSIAEDGGRADFLVTRSGGELGHEAYVRYTIGQKGDTATWFKDYRSVQSGELRFKLGETEKHIFVSSFDDSVPESNETFTIQLTSFAISRGGHGEIVNPTGRGEIVDDDYDPYVDVAGRASLAEDAARHNFFVELNEASGE